MTDEQTILFLLHKMHNHIITNQEYQQLQFLLLKNEESVRHNYPVCETIVNDYKLMFISDTHIGGKDENISFVTTSYNTF